MKAKTYAKTTPKRERLVNFRNLTDKSSILSQNLGPKTSTNEIFRVLRHPKWLLEASRQCQEGVRGSQGKLGAPKQKSQRLPGDAFGLPRGCPGRLWDAWETPRGNFGANFDPKLDDFAANLFEAFFFKVFKLSVLFFVLPDLADTL